MYLMVTKFDAISNLFKLLIHHISAKQMRIKIHNQSRISSRGNKDKYFLRSEPSYRYSLESLNQVKNHDV